MGLKGLLSKVINLARGGSGTESSSSEARLPETRLPETRLPETRLPEARLPEARLPEGRPADEPIRTRTMAELLVQQGHLERAVAIYRELDGEEARLSEIEGLLTRRDLERRAVASRPEGVALVRDSELCAIAWRVDELQLARARALLGGDGEPTVRTVRVTRVEGSARRDHEDLEASLPDGVVTVEAAGEDRLVVSVGLLDGDRFVSIAHSAA